MKRFPAPSKWMPYLPMRVYSFVVGTLRSNRTVFRMLFGYTPPPDIEGHLWDWTTLALRRALRRCVRPGARLLDMGTGPAAVLGIYARDTLRYGYVCAVDHMTEIVLSARRTTVFADIDIDVCESSLFDSVTGQYDVISFNAPYIDEASGARLGLLDSDKAMRRWSGGRDGLETIDRFLASSSAFLVPGGVVLLGVNHFYVQRGAIEGKTERNGWFIAWVIRNRWTHAVVYALQRVEGEGEASGVGKRVRNGYGKRYR